MLTYYIDKKSTVNIKTQINIKADILQFLNGRKKNQSIILGQNVWINSCYSEFSKTWLKASFLSFSTQRTFL